MLISKQNGLQIANNDNSIHVDMDNFIFMISWYIAVAMKYVPWLHMIEQFIHIREQKRYGLWNMEQLFSPWDSHSNI